VVGDGDQGGEYLVGGCGLGSENVVRGGDLGSEYGIWEDGGD
jgi:hypothetical protein